jgi:hypothetical protein
MPILVDTRLNRRRASIIFTTNSEKSIHCKRNRGVKRKLQHKKPIRGIVRSWLKKVIEN